MILQVVLYIKNSRIVLMKRIRSLLSSASKSRPIKPRIVDQQLHHVVIQWQQITIQIRKSSKARRLTLSYRPWQHIRITTPYRTADIMIQLLIKHKEQRILDRHVSSSDSIISSNGDLCDHSREHFETHKESALQFCTRKVEQWNAALWWEYNNITVKSLKTKRWSCSSKWNLNFNYKLMFLPEAMADYIIVHELCHLREMNHGPRFWKLVEEVYGPEWKKWKDVR